MKNLKLKYSSEEYEAIAKKFNKEPLPPRLTMLLIVVKYMGICVLKKHKSDDILISTVVNDKETVIAFSDEELIKEELKQGFHIERIAFIDYCQKYSQYKRIIINPDLPSKLLLEESLMEVITSEELEYLPFFTHKGN